MAEVFEVDMNGDGIEDTVVVEQQADGSILVVADTNNDGLIDVAALDVDGDGAFDAAVIDTDYDGTADETWVAGHDSGQGYASV